MKHSIAVLASLATTLQLQATAASLLYAPETPERSSVLSTSLPVSRLGRLTVPRGLVVIDGNYIDVQAVPEGLFDGRSVVSGIVVHSEPVPEKSPIAIKGLAYFFSGPWLPYVSSHPAFELIETADRTMITGRIIGGDEEVLTIRDADGRERSLRFSQIANIESPRAQRFIIPITTKQSSPSAVIWGDASSIRFEPNNGGRTVVAQRRLIAKPLGDEHGISKLTLSAYIFANVVSTVAPAVATPLVLGRSLAGPLRQIKEVNTLTGQP